MTRTLAVLFAVVLIAAGCAPTGADDSGSTASTTPSTPATAAGVGLVDIGAGVQGLPGLLATTYATGLPNVAALAVDADGRVWAATAAFDDAGTDTISLIAAAGATPVTVVTGQHTVLGLAWIGTTLFVAAKEAVTAWTGFDGTTFAAHHAVVTFAAAVGEVNGIAVSPAGRLVVGISAPCNACVTTDPDSGTVVSFLPDGTDRQVEATGIRAPVGLAYAPGTDDLYVSMNQRDDLGDATPGDWLAIVRVGQDWGFPDCYGQDVEACADVPGPVAVLDAHAAASGVAIVTGQLGTSIGTSALVAEWAKGVVLRVPLGTAGGATAVSSVSAIPFLTGLANPVPVIVDAAAGVLVGDWATGTIVRIAAAG